MGREALLLDLEESLRRPGRGPVLVVGGRLSGKTSLLDALADRLRQRSDVVPLVFDAAARETWLLEETIRDLADAVASTLELTAPDLGQRPDERFLQQWLASALSTLSPDTVLVLIIDEFDVEPETNGRSCAAAMLPFLARCLAANEGRLGLVLAAGRTLQVDEALVAQAFPSVARRHIGALERRETRALARLSEGRGGLSWEPEAIEELWWLCRGQPALTHLLLSACWTTAWIEADGAAPVIRKSTVRAAIDRALEEGTEACRWLWAGLPPAARVVAAALAEAEPPSVALKDFAELLHRGGVRVLTRDLELGPDKLRHWELFEAVEDPLSWRGDLFRRWVARHHPVSRTQAELDHLRPEAERSYSRAVRRFEAGKANEALESLQEALEANPNHLGATELMVEVELALGHADVAGRLLERLNAIQPHKGRPRLVRFLLEQAEQASDPVEASRHLDRILSLAPGHLEATALRDALNRRSLPPEPQRNELLDGQTRERIAGLEATGRLEQALALAQHSSASSNDPLLGPMVVRLQRESSVEEHYQRGLGALRSGDRRTARDNLAQVLALQPDHGEAVRLLYQAVHGVDPQELQARLDRSVPRGTLLAVAAVALLAVGGWATTTLGLLPAGVGIDAEGIENAAAVDVVAQAVAPEPKGSADGLSAAPPPEPRAAPPVADAATG